MKFSSTALAVAALLLPGSLALDPNNCNTSDKSRNGADFILVEQNDNPNVASLAKILKRVNVSDVFEAGNHKMTTDSSGRKLWEHKDDFNDLGTDKWVPQGISSTADAAEAGTYEGKNGWLVSWHRKDDDGVRVTFVDRSNDEYRHALLVYPHEADNFKEVAIHAGGIAWYGDKLYVVDTSKGIRVFDMGNIWKVGSGDAVGKSASGTYSAAGYAYVIPQIRWYKWTPSFPFRFSWISLDRTTTPHQLLVGEYQTDTASTPVRMAKFDLDTSSGKLKTTSKTAKAAWAYCVGIERMQGAVSANGKIYISRSNGADKGDMFGWVPGKTAYKNAGFFPPSPEDLSYDKRNGGRVYGLTEAAGKRYIIDSAAKSVKFS